MPSRNIVKYFAPYQHYHVYNRGVEKRNIFLDEQDYLVFIGLLKKYLSKSSTMAPTLSEQVSLLSYCLMPNHFHLQLYQQTPDGITKLLRRVITGYVMYFNARYDRVGGLFQGKYKAALIEADTYLQHISRYIHLNPDNYKHWQYSSYRYYQKGIFPEWLHAQIIMEAFAYNAQAYCDFVAANQTGRHNLEFLQQFLSHNLIEAK